MKLDFYSLEFILHAEDVSLDLLKDSLKELTDSLSIEQNQEAGEFKVSLTSAQPEAIFDTCHLFGRISKIKVDQIDREV